MYFLYLLFFFFYCYGDHRDLHSFPTRRSSDLYEVGKAYLFEVEVEDINDKISHTLISSKLIEDALEGEELSDALLKLYDYAPLNQKELKKGIESYLDKIENKNLKLITEEVYKK